MHLLSDGPVGSGGFLLVICTVNGTVSAQFSVLAEVIYRTVQVIHSLTTNINKIPVLVKLHNSHEQSGRCHTV